MNACCQLVLLPGLGADARMFSPQASAFEGLIVPPWIEPKPRESLSDYAARLTQTVRREPDCPLILGGVSLGGMIAYEMARHLVPDALVLVATCRTHEALAPYRPLVPLVRRLPTAVLEWAQWLAPLAAGSFGRCPRAIGSLMVDMFRRADPHFMRWALGALLDWRPGPPPEVPIFQIHGRHDRVIPVSRIRADRIIPDGGHLINMTHPAQVNPFLESVVEKLALRYHEV